MKLVHLVVLSTLLAIGGCAQKSGAAAIAEPKKDPELENAAKLIGNGLTDQAASILNARLAKNADDADCYLLLGANEIQKGELLKALDPYFTAAVKSRPSLKEPLFQFAVNYAKGDKSEIFGIPFSPGDHADLNAPALVQWIVRTDKKLAMSNETTAAFLVQEGEATADEFMKQFPDSPRYAEMLLNQAEHLWDTEGEPFTGAKAAASKVIKIADKKSEIAKQAKSILVDIEVMEQQAAASRKRELEQQIIGVWEPIGSGFSAWLEFGTDGMYSVGIGALKETNRYEVDGNTIRMWSKNFVNGKPYPPSKGTWSVNGSILRLHGVGIDTEFRKR